MWHRGVQAWDNQGCSTDKEITQQYMFLFVQISKLTVSLQFPGKFTVSTMAVYGFIGPLMPLQSLILNIPGYKVWSHRKSS